MTRKSMMMINKFWIGANILFDLETGKTTQVLLLVNNESDASIFSQKDANTYFQFVSRRAQNIKWYLDPPTPQRPQGYVIRGEQVMTT